MTITTNFEYQNPAGAGSIVLTELGQAFTDNGFQPVVGDKIPFGDLTNADAAAINSVGAAPLSIIVNARAYSMANDELTITLIPVFY